MLDIVLSIWSLLRKNPTESYPHIYQHQKKYTSADPINTGKLKIIEKKVLIYLFITSLLYNIVPLKVRDHYKFLESLKSERPL